VRYVAGFLRFCYDFIVGDDWTVAAGVVASLGIASLLVHRHAPAWLWLPPAAAAALAASAWRAARNRREPR
jgi:hypothetical protein